MSVSNWIYSFFLSFLMSLVVVVVVVFAKLSNNSCWYYFQVLILAFLTELVLIHIYN